MPQLFGLYLTQSGDEAVLVADPDTRSYYERKGHAFLGFVPNPAIAGNGPREIDRNDSGIPAAPDGSTHDRLVAVFDPPAVAEERERG